MSFASIVLSPLAFVYGAGARLRISLYDRGLLQRRRLGRPVISIGNLSVGGTGKTPMVIWLAEHFLAEGRRVAILSRGYRGRGGSSDEIELMKHRLGGRGLFGVGKDRYAQGKRLEQQGADIFLLDDGFQHTQLARDVDIVLLDRSQPVSEDAVLPAGRLREPVSALDRADIVVETRTNGGEPEASIPAPKAVRIFGASTELQGFRRLGDGKWMDAAELGAGPFYAFCGIGNPQAFFLDLRRWRLSVGGERAFRDHHRYTVAEVRTLQDAAERAGAQGLITTEKDFFNLAGIEGWRMPVYVCVIAMCIRNKEQFLEAIERRLMRREERLA